MAPVITEEMHREAAEKKHEDFVYLIGIIHYYFMQRSKVFTSPIASLMESFDRKGRLLFNSNYKELCTALPTWIQLRTCGKQTMMDIASCKPT